MSRAQARTPNPYHTPGAGRSNTHLAGRRLVLWALLLAPWITYGLIFATARVLLAIDRPISEGARELVILTAAGLAYASVQTLLMFPSAFVLEYLIERRLLSLEIMVVSWYPLAVSSVLASWGVVSRSHIAVQAIEFFPRVFVILIVPLFVVWCVRALLRRRRGH